MVSLPISGSDRGSDSNRRCSRRDLVVAVGTGATTALAGCGAMPGQTSPRSLNPPDIINDSATTRVWEFPRGAPDGEAPIQTYLEQTTRVPPDRQDATVRFRFGATVFDHSKYHHDRITLRVRAPANPQATRTPADILVSPLVGGFTSFRTYEQDSTTIITLSDLETTGTLQFEFVIAPRSGATPGTLGYEFEVTAGNSDLFDRSVVASDSGQVPVVRESGGT